MYTNDELDEILEEKYDGGWSDGYYYAKEKFLDIIREYMEKNKNYFDAVEFQIYGTLSEIKKELNDL